MTLEQLALLMSMAKNARSVVGADTWNELANYVTDATKQYLETVNLDDKP